MDSEDNWNNSKTIADTRVELRDKQCSTLNKFMWIVQFCFRAFSASVEQVWFQSLCFTLQSRKVCNIKVSPWRKGRRQLFIVDHGCQLTYRDADVCESYFTPCTIVLTIDVEMEINCQCSRKHLYIRNPKSSCFGLPKRNCVQRMIVRQ